MSGGPCAVQFADLRALLLGSTFHFQNEADLQEGFAMLLTAHGVPFQREVRLSKKDRIDFLVDGGLGVELKVAMSAASVLRQLHRYAEHEEIAALLLVTRCASHCRLPPAAPNGKQIWVEYLQGAFT